MDMSDGLFVAAAVVIAAGAGAVQYTAASGDRGINAFLTKEKSSNPFYDKNFKAQKPEAPAWMKRLPLPRLDFVEVYGESSSPPPAAVRLPGSGAEPTVASLYEDLDAAVEREDYAAAAAIKANIDALSDVNTDSGGD